jgi:chorismate lyase/3-hydroxybenzoate synthase
VYHPRGRAIPRASRSKSVSNLSAPRGASAPSATLPALAIGYSDEPVSSLLAREDVLAVIGFDGAMRDCGDPRMLRVGLRIVGAPLVEVWRATTPVLGGTEGAVRWSSNGDYGFFAIEIAEPGGEDIADAAERAYRGLVPVVHASATPHILRLWNYFDAINLGDGDAERYRRFCIGRARGMTAFGEDRYPAATAIGRHDGERVLQVYALAGRIAGAPVENPRQTNAWRYPREYGPTPPTFARGMTTPAGQLLISGTAAVVGAASRHRDDVAAQLDETLANIASLIRTAGGDDGDFARRRRLLKAYVRDRGAAALVETRLRAALPELAGLVILEGDVCRRELLVEIDGLCT